MVSFLLYFLGFTSDIATTCGGVEWFFILHFSSVNFSLVSTSALVDHMTISPVLALAVLEFCWLFLPFSLP